MNITFLIGNGFDLNIGKKTSYSDFYKYYQAQPSENEIIKRLKEDLDRNYKNWSDLELGLGEYTEKLKDITEFDIVFNDIINNLSNFIKYQEYDSKEVSINTTSNYFKDLLYPHNHLTRGDSDSIKKIISNFANPNYPTINIITFNYSNSIEQILTYNNKPIDIPNYPNCRIENIYHIHGFCNKRMILGVNDVSQIKNDQFKNDEDIAGTLIKPALNKNLKHLIDQDCIEKIHDSNIICLFGLSLGDTDKIWWEQIGMEITNSSSILIIYFKGTKISENMEYLIPRKENEIKNLFIEKANIPNEQIEYVKNKIYVGYNTDIFKFEDQEKMYKSIISEIMNSSPI